MNIFLAPRSNETAYKNFKSTIEDGVNFEQIKDTLTIENRLRLKGLEKIFAWGCSEGKKASWKKIQEGDWVLFYKNKEFVYCGRVLCTQYSQALALALWPAKKGREPWSCVFFLSEIHPIKLSVSELNDLSGGKYKMDRVQGFMPLKETASKLVRAASGSFEDFVDKFAVQEQESSRKSSLSPQFVGSSFEQKIIQFLKDLEFNDVDGGNAFKIGGIQVDACAGWGNALLVISCKSKVELGPKSLRDAISEWRGKIEILKREFQLIPKFKKYKHFQFILATKNIAASRVDKEYANQSPRIYLWDEALVDYYRGLYKFIRPYSKFDLLGEMHVAPSDQKPIRVPAIKINRGSLALYSFVIDPKVLLEVSFVARRNVGEMFYQRLIDERRVKKITAYIENGGLFPNNIIVAFKPNLNLDFRSEVKRDNLELGTLQFPNDYRSCWVIDGQHRLYAYANAHKGSPFAVAVTAFEHLDVGGQRKFFLDINRNQKAVDPDLLWDLSSDVPFEKEGIISNIVKTLNTGKFRDGKEYTISTPLYYKIYYPSVGVKDKNQKLKMSGICVALKNNHIAEEFTAQDVRNYLYNKDSSRCIRNFAESLSSFFVACKNVFPKNWDLGKKGFILTNGGIAAMLGLYEKMLSRTSQKEKRAPNLEEFIQYLKPLKNRIENSTSGELSKLRKSTSSEAGRADIINSFVQDIRSKTQDLQFGGQVEIRIIEREIHALEKKLKDLIFVKYHDENNPNWFEGIVDPYVLNSVKGRLKNPDDQDKLYLQTTLGECFSLLKSKKKDLYPVFVDEEKEFAFSSEKMFETALTAIAEFRNRVLIHYTGTDRKLHEEEIVKLYLDQMLRCLDVELAGERT